jgi:hypothetical protein
MAGKQRPGAPGIVADIDRQIEEVDRQLQSVRGLMARRQSLVTARNALTGERHSVPAPSVRSHLSKLEILAYLNSNPGQTPQEIAAALQAPLAAVVQHLQRNRKSLFESQKPEKTDRLAASREHRWYPRPTPETRERV